MNPHYLDSYRIGYAIGGNATLFVSQNKNRVNVLG